MLRGRVKRNKPEALCLRQHHEGPPPPGSRHPFPLRAKRRPSKKLRANPLSSNPHPAESFPSSAPLSGCFRKVWLRTNPPAPGLQTRVPHVRVSCPAYPRAKGRPAEVAHSATSPHRQTPRKLLRSKPPHSQTLRKRGRRTADPTLKDSPLWRWRTPTRRGSVGRDRESPSAAKLRANSLRASLLRRNTLPPDSRATVLR